MIVLTGILQVFSLIGMVINDFLAVISVIGSAILFGSSFFTNVPLRKFGQITNWGIVGPIIGVVFQFCMLVTGTIPKEIGFFRMSFGLVSGLFVLSFLFLAARFWLQKERKFAFSVPVSQKSDYKPKPKQRGVDITNIYVGHDVVGNLVVGNNNKVENSEKVEIKQRQVIDTRNAMDIWAEIEHLKGQTLRTLDHRKPFLIVEITDEIVIVRPLSTKKDRLIAREGIEAAMQHLKITGQLTLREIEEQFAPRNPVYISAILANFPEVRHSIRPIRLWITNKM